MESSPLFSVAIELLVGLDVTRAYFTLRVYGLKSLTVIDIGKAKLSGGQGDFRTGNGKCKELKQSL